MRSIIQVYNNFIQKKWYAGYYIQLYIIEKIYVIYIIKNFINLFIFIFILFYFF